MTRGLISRPSHAPRAGCRTRGAPIPQKPEQAQFTIELADRRLLAINGSRLEEEDAEPLQTFLTTVRQARERAQARQLAAPRRAGAAQRSVSQRLERTQLRAREHGTAASGAALGWVRGI
jgi:hypothetical protein